MIVGITGAMGGGKSTLLGIFKALGLPVCSADELAHEEYAPGSALIGDLVKRWGAGILTADGALDRVKVGTRVFNDAGELDFLNRIMAPRLRRKIEKLVDKTRRNGENLILEIPLLFEGGYEDLLDVVVNVETPDDLRRERLGRRGMSILEIDRRDTCQLSAAEKRQLADHTVENSGSPDELFAAGRALAAKLNLLKQ